MRAPPKAWNEFVEELAPRMPHDWMQRARGDADQAWIRLILLVDAEDRLASPSIDEKIATTMAELAEEREEADRRGWTALAERAKEEREHCLERLIDVAGSVLPPEHLHLFQRSIEPMLRR